MINPTQFSSCRPPSGACSYYITHIYITFAPCTRYAHTAIQPEMLLIFWYSFSDWEKKHAIFAEESVVAGAWFRFLARHVVFHWISGGVHPVSNLVYTLLLDEKNTKQYLKQFIYVQCVGVMGGCGNILWYGLKFIIAIFFLWVYFTYVFIV